MSRVCHFFLFLELLGSLPIVIGSFMMTFKIASLVEWPISPHAIALEASSRLVRATKYEREREMRI